MSRSCDRRRVTAPGGGDATLLDLFSMYADHDVAERHGTNAFLRDGDETYRTSFIDARGDEALGSTWSCLDITL